MIKQDADTGSRANEQGRRDFMRTALSVLPASSLLAASCQAELPTELEAYANAGSPALGRTQAALLRDRDTELDKRWRWQQWSDAFVGLRNQHDLARIMDSFSEEAELSINNIVYAGHDAIAQAYRLLGLSSDPGGLSNTRVMPEREHFTEEELLVYGRMRGDHTGQILHFAPTFRTAVLHYAAFYRFDEAGKIVSERIAMDWGQLASNWAPLPAT